jgi:hypothetical protein
LFAYTAQFGNGLSGTISAEARRTSQIIGALGPAAALAGTGAIGTAVPIINGGLLSGASGAGNSLGYGGSQVPDIVANLRLDQTWGSAQVMGALHELNPLYYDEATVSGEGLGHAGDQWGWVIGAGLRLNFPMIAQGDYFQGEVNYTQGALRYLFQPTIGNYESEASNQATYGLMTDCVYGSAAAGGLGGTAAAGGTGCNQTSAWSVNASYEHYWTPSVHESFVGAYAAVNYNSQANAILCNVEGSGNGAIVATVFTATPGCNNNWSVWGASSRLQWDVTKSFYLGVEVMYNRMNSASSFNGLLPGGIAAAAFPAPGPNAGSVALGGNVDSAWSATFRMHKDFLP